ncbi:MAG TPA: KAP family P-loop NTPase fold protein [Candidatus Wunengus sp. YC60]|uniref:KAP family P-loop NTPase fold protein n=1 Tax=Candidatus Wunengus sp. YC60 TaxID=3367697 RepID=UPI00402821D6
MEILGDCPINHKGEDALDRSGYAEHIAQGILKWKSKESLCLALHGPWGSGKTSLINMCLEVIKEQTAALAREEKPIIVRFQPWIISGHEQLIRAFISELRKALKKPDLSKYAHEAAEKLEVYERIFDYASWLPVPGRGYIEKLRDSLKLLKKSAQAVQKDIKDDLESNKVKICDALKKLQAPVIVTIDDVDRLTSDEIRQLFQLIKAVADFPNTIYLLAFDHLLVEKALEPFQRGSETRYLEKIVQLDFEVPNPSRSKLTSVLWAGIDQVIKTIPSEKYEQKRWNEVKFGPLPALFRNIRDVKRFLNSVNFIHPIVQGEVSPVDVLVIEAIHVFAPDLYKAIRDNKEYLLSDPMFASGRSKNEEKDAWIKKLPEMASSQFREEIQELLILLFPEVDSVFNRHSWGNSFWDIWENNKRICLSPCFEFYFKGTVAEGEISAKEVDNVIKELPDYENLAHILKNYMMDGRIKKLLPKIEHHFKQNHIQQTACNFIAAVFEAGESLPLKPDGMMEMPLDWLIDGTLYRILKVFDIGERKSLIAEAVSRTKNGVLFPVSLINFICREWYPLSEGDKKKDDEEKLLTQVDTDEIKEVALKLIRERSNGDSFFKTRHLIAILHDWERWANIDEVKTWVTGIIADDKKIPEFLGGCGGFSGSTGMDSHFATYKFQINPKNLDRYCDIQQLKIKCERIIKDSPEWLTDNYKEILSIFIKGFEKKDMWDD